MSTSNSGWFVSLFSPLKTRLLVFTPFISIYVNSNKGEANAQLERAHCAHTFFIIPSPYSIWNLLPAIIIYVVSSIARHCYYTAYFSSRFSSLDQKILKLQYLPHILMLLVYYELPRPPPNIKVSRLVSFNSRACNCR